MSIVTYHSKFLGPVTIGTAFGYLTDVHFGHKDEVFQDLDVSSKTGSPESDIVDNVLTAIDYGFVDPTLPIHLQGTDFQKKVWEMLRNIPFGKTRSYQDIADMLRMPTAARAVANACGANPIAVIVPCHRVVRKDGSLGGYRWGMDKKRYILDMEKI